MLLSQTYAHELFYSFFCHRNSFLGSKLEAKIKLLIKHLVLQLFFEMCIISDYMTFAHSTNGDRHKFQKTLLLTLWSMRT